jgi:hypothetical protein
MTMIPPIKERSPLKRLMYYIRRIKKRETYIRNIHIDKSSISSTAATASGSIPGTDVVSYIDVVAATLNGVLTSRAWTDETVTTFAANLAIPRTIVIKLTGGATDTNTGDVQINGLSADGETIDESESLSCAKVPATDTKTTSKAFKEITSVVVSNSASVGATYTVGWTDIVGFPNIAWGATSDLFGLTLNGGFLNRSRYTIDAENGTVAMNDVAALINGDDLTAWMRPNK